MKKIFILLFLPLFILPACSSSDDHDSVIAEFNKSELNDIGIVGGYYRLKNGSALLVVEDLYVVDTRCPRYKKHEKADKPSKEGLHIYCTGSLGVQCSYCNAAYFGRTGESDNEIAKGTKLKSYKFDYNEETEHYIVYN